VDLIKLTNLLDEAKCAYVNELRVLRSFVCTR